MTRSVSALFALLSVAAAAAPAAASQVHFRAQPVAVPAEARLVVRDTVFRCADSGCVAPRASSRAEIVCSALVREIGAVSSFSANGRSFGADELAACNRAAR